MVREPLPKQEDKPNLEKPAPPPLQYVIEGAWLPFPLPFRKVAKNEREGRPITSAAPTSSSATAAATTTGARKEERLSPKTHAEASRQRRDLVSGAVMDEARLIRFVAAPDGAVTPDLGRKLPGRGMWVQATRGAVDQAAKKGGFSRSAKAKLNAAPDLADQVETLLARQCLDRLGLARRAGGAYIGL